MSLVGKEWRLSIDTESGGGRGARNGGCGFANYLCLTRTAVARRLPEAVRMVVEAELGSKGRRCEGRRQQLGGAEVAVVKAAGVTVARVNTSLNLA